MDELRRIHDKHRKIIRLFAMGYVEELQGKLDEHVREMEFQDVQEMLKIEAPASVDVIRAIRDGEGEFQGTPASIRLRAAKTLAAMAGHGEVKRTQVDIAALRRVTPEDLERIRRFVDGNVITLHRIDNASVGEHPSGDAGCYAAAAVAGDGTDGGPGQVGACDV